MATCRGCGKTSTLISSTLKACNVCLRLAPAKLLPYIFNVHAKVRREFGLPESPPRTARGKRCPLCVNECRLGEGEKGFCGLRIGRGGRLVHLGGTAAKGILHWYYDPLPTNCVADWVCPGTRQYGKVNLAVFYGACTYDCLFCQNWHFRELGPETDGLGAEELAAKANWQTFCVCFFGGDPTPQMPHALAAARLLARRGVRICWETNGSMHPEVLDQAVRLSLETGGCAKFDLKAYSEGLHLALTGVTNRRALENFSRAAELVTERPDPPLVIASTLLVPGYVDAHEVGQLARFIAAINPEIPYALLAFHPHFYLHDLPRTSRRHAEACLQAAREAGLTNVKIGNRQLLSNAY